MTFLTTHDQEEQLLMQAVANGVMAIQQQRDKNLAVLIANEVGKMFGGGS